MGGPRLVPLKLLLKQLEAVCHLYVKIRGKRRTGGFCERCGIRLIFSANHVLSSGDWPGTRYDEDNIYAGCAECNERERWHRQPELEWWRQKLGPEKMDALVAKGRHRDESGELKQWNRAEIMEEITRFKKLLAGGR